MGFRSEDKIVSVKTDYRTGVKEYLMDSGGSVNEYNDEISLLIHVNRVFSTLTIEVAIEREQMAANVLAVISFGRKTAHSRMQFSDENVRTAF